ncbi:MAG: G-D-S-L family lipolytic protein [Flavobacteriales bacterium]|nr:G-D-S-L family lipolytic protein [Flavobacteriia bacterium]NCP06199.1 G-D-S-L family lipolytic protein [Flavobacteriales bacterium]PIV92578.1 MAG: G-D-S-L family lipolytic protein [Flavobacteriaceae bacterium CG17_big_fil_post_rev_8_21_14_2_50_33_15]PIY12674.1 MAG: G-D-S-L family lipolytic protein [Flavobacteriaceae bacterium CG_4_10_14_3_um_filter_33_47]PJB17226.1 MAG: G-D-S-L family lipolytic protein [Flavobacteriaceae bacterium CG_4_9_14_3_um_filter_33_16]
MKTKYFFWFLFVIFIGFTACNDIEDVLADNNIETTELLPELTSGTADFTKYVAIGASFTAGYTDNALFVASQENSFPNIMAKEFAKIGSGSFNQPLTNDNFGGLAVGGTRIADPRLVFGGAGPVPLESLVGPVTVTTDIALNNPTGPFNNLGVPGAKSFHLIAPGFGNLANFPAAANPYAVRLTGNSPNASVLELAMAQSPTFFTLSEVGGNDVLGYATSGGDGSNPITDTATFDFAFNTLVTTLTSGGAKGVVTNVPYITDLPHFTTVPYNPLSPNNPSFGPLIPTLNGVFGQLNQVFAFLQVPERSVVFSTTEASPVVIKDETLTNLSAQIAGVLNASPTFPAFVQSFGLPAQAAPLVANLFGTIYGQTRQATEDDLLVLPSSSVIGTVNTTTFAFLLSQGLPQALAGQFSVEGVTNPLEDKWVLLPSEQLEIKTATDAYNTTIESVANSNANVALVDLNSILDEASTTGISYNNFTLNTNLVTGGAVSLDGIHLTARGYAFMANKFLEAIDAAFGSNFKESGNVANIGDYPTNYPRVIP